MKSTFFLALCLATGQIAAFAQDTTKAFIFRKAEVEAYYPGGNTAWIKFLNHTLHYPDEAINNEIHGDVVLQFIVNTDSTISDIHVVSGPKKGGLREEAMRVIRLSGKWVPATQNDVVVKSLKKQSISFRMEIIK